MSYAHSATVWRIEGMEPMEKLVLLALADHADDAGLCWPSITTLESRTGMSRATVCRKLAALETAGHIVRDQGSFRNSTRYQLAMPNPANQSQPETSLTQILVSEGDQSSLTQRPG